MIRTVAIVILLARAARAQPGGGDPGQPTLSARDVAHYFRPYVPAVRACYAANVIAEGDGSISLDLAIAPDGSVERTRVTAPGVGRYALRRLDTCVREASTSWHFPVRRDETRALMPFVMRSHP